MKSPPRLNRRSSPPPPGTIALATSSRGFMTTFERASGCVQKAERGHRDFGAALLARLSCRITGISSGLEVSFGARGRSRCLCCRFS